MRLVGHLVVRDIELAERDRVIGLRVEPGSEGEFLSLPFDEAIANFLSRNLVSPEEFASMSDQERFRSFTMSLVASETLRERALDDLRDAMQPGGMGLREFIQTYQNQDGGIPRHYLENVYRTSTSVSYGAGRYEQQTQPHVAAALPYWEYLTVGDDRVRPAHAALHEAVFRVGSPEGNLVYPPNGFQCRCTVVSLDKDEADLSRLRDTVDAEQLAAVHEGFRGPPTGHIEEESGTRSVFQVPAPVEMPTPVKDAVDDLRPADIFDAEGQRRADTARAALEWWVGNSTDVTAQAGRWDDPSADLRRGAFQSIPRETDEAGFYVGATSPEELSPEDVAFFRDTMRRVQENTRRHWVENGLGTVRVERGLTGEQARRVREAVESGAEWVEVDVRALSSWTTDPEQARVFARSYAGDGAILAMDVTEADVFATHHSTSILRTEAEVVVKRAVGPDGRGTVRVRARDVVLVR